MTKVNTDATAEMDPLYYHPRKLKELQEKELKKMLFWVSDYYSFFKTAPSSQNSEKKSIFDNEKQFKAMMLKG